MPCGVGAWEMLMMRDVIAAPCLTQLNKDIDVQPLHIYIFVQLCKRECYVVFVGAGGI
jgi:hypothetical protein